MKAVHIFLKAKSPYDGSTKQSKDIKSRGRYTFRLGNAPLKVKMVNGITGLAVPDIKISAYERLGADELKHVLSHSTDNDGKAVFDLDGLDSGRTYVLKATPYNGGTVVSAVLNSPGNYRFRVGTFELTVMDGGTGAEMPGVKVVTYEQMSNGNVQWRKSGETDESGIIRFDLPGLGESSTYILKAKSPYDGSTKQSKDIKSRGRYTFLLGNAPLKVKMVNGITGKAVPNIKISAYERLGAGELKHVLSHSTNNDGKAVFDLDGLGAGRTYVLKTTPYNGGTVVSAELNSPGHYRFRVGTFEVTVVDGGTGSVMPGVKVMTYEQMTKGNDQLRKSGETDESGVIRFDLPGLGEGSTYILKAKSPYDGSTKQSKDIKSRGRYTFLLGNAPLKVKMVNGITGKAVPDIKISAYERLGAGELKHVLSHSTNNDGKAVFDLDGLGAGRTYVLKATPYNGGTVYSTDLSEAGNFIFRVGTVPVLLQDANNNNTISNQQVVLYEKLFDEKLEWQKSGKTRQGWNCSFRHAQFE